MKLPATILSPERWRAIETALEGALEQPPGDRAAFLDRACGDDVELRREVESLIAAVPATGFLEQAIVPALRVPEGAAGVLPDDGARGGARDTRNVDDVTTRLAHAVRDRYRIEHELGRGGMAIVYRAVDLRHRRSVAIKVLYPELSAILGPERFLQEIEVTAALQHPHILPLYDSGSADGLLFYVMPAIDGETLRQRMSRERHLPIGDAVRIASEVAGALAHAHARGVVHRDVKPENILLQGDHALVADFGIALAVEHAGGERMTRTGVSPGTPQYMAPEQAMGDRVIDARADLYALGVVTYEMLAAEAPFGGPSGQAVVARVLTESAPPLSSRRPQVPVHVEAAVRWAMERIAADRPASAQLFVAALSDPSVTRDYQRAMRTRSAPPWMHRFAPARRTIVSLTAIALFAMGGGAAMEWFRAGGMARAIGAPTDAPAMRVAIDADTLSRRVEAPAISPDGRTIVYAERGTERSALLVRRLDEVAGRPLAGTEFGEHPFFSPDGREVGFFSKDALWIVPLEGGKGRLATKLPVGAQFAGASWGANGDIVIALAGRGLFRVAREGGELTRVTTEDSDAWLVQPHLLADGRGAIVTVVSADGAPRVGVVTFATGRVRTFGTGSGARPVAGHVVFARDDGALVRQRFDPATLAPVGDAVRIVESIDGGDAATSVSSANFDIAPNGTVVYRALTPRGDAAGTRLVVTDRSGRALQAIAARAPWSPRLSPDGARVAYGAFAPGRETSDVWVTELATGTTLQLTDDDRDSNDPRWSPDGTAVAFSARVEDGKDLFVQRVDGGIARALTRREGSEWPSEWSERAGGIVFTQWWPSDQRDIWLQPTNGAQARALIATRAQESAGTLSPDGRWLAYQSDVSGRAEIHVASVANPSKRLLVSDRGGINPRWRGDGAELFYWEGDQLVAVDVRERPQGEELAIGARSRLFRAPYTPGELPMYDVSRDGRRIVLVTEAARRGRLIVSTGSLGAESR